MDHGLPIVLLIGTQSSMLGTVLASYPGPEGGEKRAWYLLHAHAPTTPRKPGVPRTTVRFFALLLRPRVRGYTDMTSLRTLGARGERKSVQSFAVPQVFLG